VTFDPDDTTIHGSGPDLSGQNRRTCAAVRRGSCDLLFLALLVGGGWCLPGAAASSRPNILVILADDMGIGDLSCLNPQSAWKTPSLDRLAREGRIFTDAHCASGGVYAESVCLLTGTLSRGGDA
jgi:hypothetical protein